MESVGGRYIAVFNGEIYNHLSLRQDLATASVDGHAIAWRGHSDTETLLACIEAWGLEEALRRAVGMFAIAVWDRQTRLLYMARDRLGEKPLYYSLQGGILLFASELKALRANPLFRWKVDRGVLTSYLRYGYVPAPCTIYEEVYKLQPGTCLPVSQHDMERRSLPEPIAFWSAHAVARKGQEEPYEGDATEAINDLESILSSAVRSQMISDVPLGAFLSGGIDSTTIVALMQAAQNRPIKTFTIGFDEDAYNEAAHARTVARHLGTEHTELYVTPEQSMAIIPDLPTVYDEPFSDSSQIPTILVSQLTHRHVSVALTGDGGDELFGGYNRHFWVPELQRRFCWAPAVMREVIASGIKAITPGTWDTIFGRLAPFMPARWRYGVAGDKLHKLADVLAKQDWAGIYEGLISNWATPERLVIGVVPAVECTSVDSVEHFPLSPAHAIMLLDMVGYLADDILTKVDRAAMSVSLETRVPFLDHRVVEFAWRLPLDMKIRGRQGKWITRQILQKYVPSALVNRPKMGFGVPLDSWLRGPLREWAEGLLDERRILEDGYLSPVPIRTVWKEHLSGRRNWAPKLWCILMFQAWLEANR